MEVLRSQFFKPTPSAIDALAYSPDGKWLAVSREQGAIELWNVEEQQRRLSIAGDASRSVRSFVWRGESKEGRYEDLRLFSAGVHGEVTEWDLVRCCAKSSEATNGGAGWDMCGTVDGLAVACDDGSVRLFSIKDDSVVYEKALRGGKSKCLSVCRVDDYLFVGGSDSSISRWSLKTNICDERMSLEKQANPTLVWALTDLGNGMFASADSLGLVQVWDVATCTLISRFAEHQADVLCLSYVPELRQLVAGGLDQKISFYSIGADAVTFKNAAFNHSSDVKALASMGAMVASGGNDAELHFHNLDPETKAYFHHTSPYAALSASMVSVSSSARLVLCQQRKTADIWYLQPPKEGEDSPAPVKMWELNLAGESRHLMSSALSPNGKFVALSDSAGTRLFELDLSEMDCSQIPVKEVASVAASSLKFVSDEQLVVCDHSNFEVMVIDFVTGAVDRFSGFKSPVSVIASTAPWLAASDLSGATRIYRIDEDGAKATSVAVPRFAKGVVTAMAISGSTLVMASSSREWQAFDLEKKELKESGVVKGIEPREKVLGILPTAKTDKFLFWGHNFMAKMNLAAIRERNGQNLGKRKHFSTDAAPWQFDRRIKFMLAALPLKSDAFGELWEISEEKKSQEEKPEEETPEEKKPKAKKRKVNGKAKRSGERCGVLVCEVTPEQVKALLPTSFQRKCYNGRR